MKRTFLFIAVVLIISSCQNQEGSGKEMTGILKDTSTFTTIEWIDSVKNIGAVEPGKKAHIEFRFKNTGTAPLIVVSAQPGCGCTVADYPKEPIAPGAEGVIVAAYNAPTGTTGAFRKNISVTTNTTGATGHTIFFFGDISAAGDKENETGIDTASLHAMKQKELKKIFLLKPPKIKS